MKIALYGHFGSLNSGNESTLLAILSRLRDSYPECEFCCICTNPETVVATYAIEAVPIGKRNSRIWDGQLSVSSRLKTSLVGIRDEFREYARAFRTLKGTNMLIVPGTGLLTDAYGLSGWGPLNLFKWSTMAKLRGCNLLFVSVGAGPINSGRGRFLLKSALFLANYRSYRDTSSRDYLKRIGYRSGNDRVYPDLVFGLPEDLLPAGAEPRGRRVVGLGVMTDAGPYGDVGPTRETYTSYLKSLVAFAEWLLARNYDIRLLFGDGDGDPDAIQEFKALLQARLGTFDEGRVIDQPIASVQEMLSELAATDVVVATRFHNVLLALLLTKPVIAISFHHKCVSLMTQMGLSDYSHDIGQIDTGRLINQFRQLERNSDEIKRDVSRKVKESRRDLEEQYELLFNAA